MIRKLLKLIIILLQLSASTFSQNVMLNTPSNLKVGDYTPDILITKIINNDKSSAKISDFKDQLLLIDFWSTTCSACIEALPKLDSLQKQFDERIKILPVNYESVTVVSKFLKKGGYNLPSVAEDKILSKWFKHRVLPHEVWIYKGKIIGITDGQYVDARNIQKVLNGETINWPIKDDFLNYDYSKPIFKKNTDQNYYHPAYIAITGYQIGALPKIGTVIDSIQNTRRDYIINYSILRAYQVLWKELIDINQIPSAAGGGTGNFGGFTPTQLILEVKNPNKYIYNNEIYREEWNRKNLVSYECISSNVNIDKKIEYQNMINDFDRLLGLHGRWEKQLTKCFSLVQIDTKTHLKTIGGPTKFIVYGSVKKLRNSPLRNIVYWMNSIPGNPPIFDESNYKELVDLNLNINSWKDIPKLKKELQQYGLDLKEESRIIDVFILTENKFHPD